MDFKYSIPNTKLFINGEFVDSVVPGGKKFKTYNPVNGSLITEVVEGFPEDVDIAVKAARDALNGAWGNMSAEDRGKLMFKLADLIEENIDEIAHLETLDNGKPFSASKGYDVTSAHKCIRYFAGYADKIHGKTIPMDNTFTCMTKHEPIGVVGAILPWNFPVMLLSWKLGPALAAGCTIVAKQSEFTPLTSLYMCQLIKLAGFPPGVFNLINGYGHTVGNAISHHKGINKVSFTGSTRTGRLIMEAAAKSNLKKVTLELGGKSPNIVFGDVDIEAVAINARDGLFGNMGQSCCAGSRLFVHESIYDAFMQIFIEKVKHLKVGDPWDTENHQGPLVSKEQLDRVLGYIEKGKAEGATCVLGGAQHGECGYFVKPTIFTNVTDDMTICKEEIFGPVVCVLKFSTVDEVIERANETSYGLAAGIYTKDLNTALIVSSKLDAGSVWINDFSRIHAQLPFGGYKESGIGKDLSKYAIYDYISVKAVTFAHPSK